ncbi:MAG: sugar ABC transporter ATP-binding protein [Oscillospiraceae bacterium]|nr:sugar ABC transporter ATP-binding protein [Oscillospiraceae bacterium]
MSEYSIEMKDIVMEFDGVRALDMVDFRLEKGEIRGLVGKNGAGKSTLMKIINGVYVQTAGNLRFFGKEIPKNTSVKQREKTVSMIYQDYSLAGEMSVVHNIFMGDEPKKLGLIDDKACLEKVREFFRSLDIQIDPLEKVKNLSVGDMQFVEIAKAIIKNTGIILMDEPTAALDVEATQKFFSIIEKLKERGYSMVISTHHLKQIMQVCDSVSVICDGKNALEAKIADTTLDEIIYHMLGQTDYIQKKRIPKPPSAEKPLLVLKDLTSKSSPAPMSLEVYPGEVLGLAGLKGSGRTEILSTIFGIDPPTGGSISLDGEKRKIRSPHQAIENGIFLVPENRHTQGLSLMHSVYDNALLPILPRLVKHLFIDDNKGGQVVDDIIDSLMVKTPNKEITISKLSGGNQQKVVLGKALKSEPKIMLMDDPAYGVDIHAKNDISAAIERFTESGGGVIYVSSELSEMLENCDRILIIKYGKIVGEIKEIPTSDQTEDSLLAAIQ